MYKADGAARVEESLKRSSIHLHFTSAAPGGSWWTAQPASQALLGERGGAVGMGSSCGPGTAGLLTGREVPSGARRSWTNLRGKGGTRSHHPHTSCLSEGAKESPKKFGDYHTLGDLTNGGTPGKQPMTRQPREFGRRGHGRATASCIPTPGITGQHRWARGRLGPGSPFVAPHTTCFVPGTT